MRHCELASCGAELVRGDNEPTWSWKKRRFCGNDCVHQWQRDTKRGKVAQGTPDDPPPEKPCAVCETGRVVKKEHETIYNFRRRETCSEECRNASMMQKRREAQGGTFANEGYTPPPQGIYRWEPPPDRIAEAVRIRMMRGAVI